MFYGGAGLVSAPAFAPISSSSLAEDPDEWAEKAILVALRAKGKVPRRRGA